MRLRVALPQWDTDPTPSAVCIVLLVHGDYIQGKNWPIVIYRAIKPAQRLTRPRRKRARWLPGPITRNDAAHHLSSRRNSLTKQGHIHSLGCLLSTAERDVHFRAPLVKTEQGRRST